MLKRFDDAIEAVNENIDNDTHAVWDVLQWAVDNGVPDERVTDYLPEDCPR